MASDFSTGTIIQQIFQVYLANFIPFTLIALLGFLPLIVFQGVFFDPNPFREPSPAQALANLGGAVITMLLQQIVVGAIVFGVFQFLRGKKAGLGECFATGFQRFLPVLGTAFVAGLATGAAFLCLCIPGLIVATILYVAVPVAVIENPGVGESLKRSATLTSGFRWEVFFINLGIQLLAIIAQSFGVFVLKGWPQFVVSQTVIVLFAAIGGVTSSLVYFRLRQVKESVQDAEEIAAVFD